MPTHAASLVREETTSLKTCQPLGHRAPAGENRLGDSLLRSRPRACVASEAVGGQAHEDALGGMIVALPGVPCRHEPGWGARAYKDGENGTIRPTSVGIIKHENRDAVY